MPLPELDSAGAPAQPQQAAGGGSRKRSRAARSGKHRLDVQLPPQWAGLHSVLGAAVGSAAPGRMGAFGGCLQTFDPAQQPEAQPFCLLWDVTPAGYCAAAALWPALRRVATDARMHSAPPPVKQLLRLLLRVLAYSPVATAAVLFAQGDSQAALQDARSGAAAALGAL